LEIAAPPHRVRLDAMATLQEWLADPAGAVALREAIGVDAEGRPRGILGDDELARVIGSFPLSSLATFPGSGIDHDMIMKVVQGLQSP
jgi:beta-glucosidase